MAINQPWVTNQELQIMRYGILHVDLMNVESLHVDVVTRAWSPQRSRTRNEMWGSRAADACS